MTQLLGMIGLLIAMVSDNWYRGQSRGETRYFGLLRICSESKNHPKKCDERELFSFRVNDIWSLGVQEKSKYQKFHVFVFQI